MTLPYKTPAAFRRALTDRLRSQAHPHGPWPLPELQRQFAYDRLLARLYLVDGDWIVKGATALLARELAVRRTVDIDLYRDTGREAAEHDLREAAVRDLGDWFRFETGRSTPVSDGANGVRVPVTSRLGTTVWTRFHVDVVAENIRMTGAAEDVPPLPPLDVPGLERSGYRAYPLVDHIADKTCAILERHGPEQRPSTRFKDLVDLVSVVSRTALPADEQRTALYSEAERRDLVLPAASPSRTAACGNPATPPRRHAPWHCPPPPWTRRSPWCPRSSTRSSTDQHGETGTPGPPHGGLRDRTPRPRDTSTAR
ncbi:nucleotidyl transferase AbiEii/AbiGii toxin family protein [Nocardiopsis flavescens]|uniref:nucleotidyl transferase AbiEii/AbiGii toxin family protein n=1 Tax=Nocardiopsis flavescens TaxID=758803 RepID=UPI0036676716